jgi:putative PIN family toxin of toxin-antitoxin system
LSAPVFPAATEGRRAVVLDTNIVLDAFIFNDPAVQPLREGLQSGALQWIATQPMRDELARVLAYPKIVKRLVYYQLDAASVLAQFDTLARTVDVAPKASATCKDADDQKFIDLAVAHQSLLLSKDQAVLCMTKRLLALGSIVQTAIKNVA